MSLLTVLDHDIKQRSPKNGAFGNSETAGNGSIKYTENSPKVKKWGRINNPSLNNSKLIKTHINNVPFVIKICDFNKNVRFILKFCDQICM